MVGVAVRVSVPGPDGVPVGGFEPPGERVTWAVFVLVRLFVGAAVRLIVDVGDAVEEGVMDCVKVLVG